MGDLAEEEQQLPLVGSLSSPDASEESIERTGEKSKRICVVLAQESLWGTGITYTMTTATSIRYET
ncbi:hypothetical protein Pint_03666 [Pistacia integerrima]|uniref:Uncharacterized protein n=1 Tax=Pistacia integerrima TaxID=434235 RepID=A0ACC0Z097_9ROSI|nr:hypothetical protein Pint_03666 [Pistacia integerrima]